ncbi:MAG TPA: hypothetical protein VGJ94_01965 [Syntrophorhabdaceae bacterium]|jgi:hypothetical protein
MEKGKLWVVTIISFFIFSMSPFTLFGQRSDESIQEWQKDILRFPQGGKVETGIPEPTVGRAQTRQGFIEEAWSSFRDLDRKIYDLGRKIERRGEPGPDAQKSWEDLKVKREETRKQLTALPSVSKEAWESAKSETNGSLDNLNVAYNKTASYFR